MKFLLLSLALLDLSHFDAFVTEEQTARKVPGAAIVIVQEGKPVYLKGFGVLEAGKDTPVDENTLFQLASVSKSFTAAALGVQVDHKRLTFDAPVIEHLPFFLLKDAYATRFATARDLLSHRTGLPAFGGDLLGKLGYTPPEILQRIALIEPETTFRNRAYYSNVGYFLAGELLAHLADSSWEEAIQHELLTPLEMKRSGFAASLDGDNVAKPHILLNGKLKTVPWDRTGGFAAAGGVTSTASDMGHWIAMLLNGGKYKDTQILEEKTLQELFQPVIAGEVAFSEAPPIDENSGYSFSLGWDVYHYHGHQIIEKGGGLDGIRTVVTLIPDLKLGIAVLSNLNLTMFPEAIRAHFLELALGQEENLQEKIREKEKILGKLLAAPDAPKKPLPPSHPLEDYAGAYASKLYGTFRVKPESTHLVLDAGPLPFHGTLTHFSNDTFTLTWPIVNSGNQQVTFTFGPDGKPTGFQTESIGTFTRS